MNLHLKLKEHVILKLKSFKTKSIQCFNVSRSMYLYAGSTKSNGCSKMTAIAHCHAANRLLKVWKKNNNYGSTRQMNLCSSMQLCVDVTCNRYWCLCFGFHFFFIVLFFVIQTLCIYKCKAIAISDNWNCMTFKIDSFLLFCCCCWCRIYTWVGDDFGEKKTHVNALICIAHQQKRKKPTTTENASYVQEFLWSMWSDSVTFRFQKIMNWYIFFWPMVKHHQPKITNGY